MKTENTGGDADRANAQGGLASWEEPRLPLAQRVRRQWRQMLVHVWGPAGSVVFHVVAVGALLTMVTGSGGDVIVSPPVDVPVNHKEEVIEPKPVEPPVKDIKQPVPDASFERDESAIGFSSQPFDEPIGGSGMQDRGTGIGSGSPDLPQTGFEIDARVKSRMIMRGLNTGPTAGGRKGRLGQYIDGGKNPHAAKNEVSVLRSLRWLKREQQPDGSWSGSKQNVPPAMTSMALLAFLAHAETPDSPEFGPTVKKAIAWLLANQESDGRFKGRDAHDYSQPIAAYALCEACSMTEHPQVREAAIRAITLVVRGQHASGGFNYNLDQSMRNDTSYMAWCCQALKAAKMAKLQDDVPGLEAAIKKGAAGFRLNADPNGGFGYENTGRTGLSGAGALCLQLLGAPRAAEVVNTLKFLETCTFSFATPDQQPYGGGSQVYYWYYITQAKFNQGPEMFAAWDRQFSPELRRTQIVEKDAIEGPNGKMVDVGHWESPVKGEHTGGVVQDTALCTLMMEVYYRYLSTSQHVDVDTGVLAGARSDDVGNIVIH